MKMYGVELRHKVVKLRLVVYRSPSMIKEDDEKLHKAIADISKSNCMIMGDFNHPGINWNYLESATDSEAFLLLTQDCFLTQHVLEPTRGGNVFDLVLWYLVVSSTIQYNTTSRCYYIGYM